MIFLDTNVVIDLLNSDQSPGVDWSRNMYRDQPVAQEFGCNLIVVAEIAAQGGLPDEIAERFDRLRIQVLELQAGGAFAAGRAHRAYRRNGGLRTAILADFLIAGHAEALGVPFATRDRRLGSYFPDLTLITPETHP